MGLFRIFKRTIGLLFKLNIIKTLYLNFRFFPISKALKFPIFVFGKLHLASLNGKISIESPIETGMVKIGLDLDGFPENYLPVRLHLNGSLLFQGAATISGGTNLTVWSGELVLGRFCTIGSGCVIKCSQKIQIGELTRIVARCVLMDTDVHFVRNITTGIVKKNFGEILIGRYCWINYGTVVSKSTVLPDYCIVARNSYLSKDYSQEVTIGSFLAGSPAVVKAKNLVRIFSRQSEVELQKYFKHNGQSVEIKSQIGLVDEAQEVASFFRYFKQS